MREINVVLVDQDPQSVEEFLKRVFSRGLGRELSITRVRSSELSIEGRRSPFIESVVDVFVCDLSLGDTSSPNFGGLTRMRDFKRLYPDIYVIGASRYDLTYYETSEEGTVFDVFVQKALFKRPVYVAQIADYIRRTFLRNVDVELDSSEPDKLGAFSKPSGIWKLNRLLRQMTFTSHSVSQATAVERVKLEPLDEGRSGSNVFRMYAFTSTGLPCIHSVLKISTVSRMRKEYENYLNYVKWYLPYTWRPEILGTGVTNDWGALCYSFAYNDELPFHSLWYHILAKNEDKVTMAIDRILEPRHQRWYHFDNVAKEDGDLGEYYQLQWFQERSGSEHRFRQVLGRSADFSKSHFTEINGFPYPVPKNFLFTEPVVGYHTCIRHGDLHGQNILLADSSEEITFIDFQDTGRGHVFEDFVTLESSIRMGWNAGMGLVELIEAEEAEIFSKSSSLSYGPLVRKVREFAFANFLVESPKRYVFALALNSYRLLRVSDLASWQYEQLAAAVLACMRYLRQEGWE